MLNQLRTELSQHIHLRERLSAEFVDVDEDTLRDTLEGLTDLPEILAALVRSYLDDKAIVGGLRCRMAEMQERLSRLEARASKKRDLVTRTMEEADVRQLSEPDFTASLRVNKPHLVVIDEKTIPEDFWLPQPPKLDRLGLGNAMRGGQRVPGAELGHASVSLAVRTK